MDKLELLENINITAQKIVDFTLANKIKFSIAESLTGGLVTASIVAVSGCSAALNEGLCTYSNQSKHQRLGVKTITLETFGAVSEQTAIEMARGLIINDTDFAVSTTGIAGPKGDTKTKVIGLTYIGVADKNDAVSHKFIFEGNREIIRLQATMQALNILLSFIKSRS